MSLGADIASLFAGFCLPFELKLGNTLSRGVDED